MQKNRNILILSAGRRVELVHAFQDAVKNIFSNAQVFATDLHPEHSAACYQADKSFLAPPVNSAQYTEFLVDLCEQYKIGMVIPTIDSELCILSESRQKFENRNIKILISGPNLVSACRDKRQTGSVFEKLNIDTPEIYDKCKIKFPCFCKPYDGSSSKGALALHSKADMTPEIFNDRKNIFMELVPKEYKEYTLDAYYDKNHLLKCLVPRERLEVRGGEVSKGITRKDYVYDFLLGRLHKVDEAIGCITIQVFANDVTKSVKAIEINPRFGGGFPLSEAAGAKYPEWLVREYFLNENLDFFDGWEPDLLMLRYDAKVIVRDFRN